MKKLIFILLISFISCTTINKKTNYYFIKGLNEYQKNNKIEALENYKKAYNSDNKNLKVLRELGFLYMDLGDIEKAKEYYQKVLKIKQYDSNSLDNLIRIAYIQGDYESVEKYSEQILDKNSLSYTYSKLRLAIYNKDYINANIYYRTLLNNKEYEEIKDKNLYNYYLEIVEALSVEKSSKIYDKLYVIYYENKEFIEDYADLLINDSQIVKAEKVLLKASVDIDDSKDLLLKLAYLYQKTKNTKKYNEVMKILKN